MQAVVYINVIGRASIVNQRTCAMSVARTRNSRAFCFEILPHQKRWVTSTPHDQDCRDGEEAQTDEDGTVQDTQGARKGELRLVFQFKFS